MILVPVLSDRYASDRVLERLKELDKDFLVILVIDKDKNDFFLSMADYMWKGKQFAEHIAEDLGAEVITEWGNTVKKIYYLLHFEKADKVAFIKDPFSRSIAQELEKKAPSKVIYI